MQVIDQRLVVRDWPLNKPGDELFFGYVVGLGVFPGEWDEQGEFAYADFAYSDGYVRYRLPPDEGLMTQLLEYLCQNLEANARGEGIYGKVWVSLSEEGYRVELP